MRLASFQLRNNVFVAPMAGVTDRPFRQLCKRLGAGYAVSEMAASNPELWHSEKTSRRLNHDGEMEPKAVQIAGADPEFMARAALYNVERGAQVIDINAGCPAKKVCRVAAGSALLADEGLVAAILERVVAAVTVRHGVPVTLKYRTGPDAASRNAVAIARIAEGAGIAMLTLHGRTRADKFLGHAEYETIGLVKAAVTIPVIANGDIDSPEKARAVLRSTGADGVMIGRAAQGRPWIFHEVAHFLEHGVVPPPPSIGMLRRVLREHLTQHYAFYGEALGMRTARKHIGWYVERWPAGAALRAHMNRLESCTEQMGAVDAYLRGLGRDEAHVPAPVDEERMAA